MQDPVYEKLTDALNMGGGLPVIKCPELYALLREMFTPEEGALASQMPMNPVSAADLAAEIGRDPGEVERLLEGMANKGLIYAIERGGVMEYSLLPVLPGIFEVQLMKGEVSEEAKKLAHLFEDYFAVMYQGGQEGGTGMQFPQFPLMRVITVEAEIPAGMEIQPYDSVSQYIENSEYISLGICYCRHLAELLGNPCDKPKDVCMGFGEGAKFLSQRGFARLVSKEEALEALDRAEKAGLVHSSSNTSENIGFICNCCSCHCKLIQSLIKGSFIPGLGPFRASSWRLTKRSAWDVAIVSTGAQCKSSACRMTSWSWTPTTASDAGSAFPPAPLRLSGWSPGRTHRFPRGTMIASKPP